MCVLELRRVERWERADVIDRMNVHLAEDGTVRHVDFK